MLKQRAFSATLWSTLDILFRQGMLLFVTLLLAHLLAPTDFGLFALTAIFVGIASVFVDGGFSSALIREQDVSHVDESTVFWLNLGVGFVCAVSLGLASSAIASFYEQPALTLLLRALAINIVLGALTTIHTTLLTKKLKFAVLLKAGIASTLISGSAAVLLAMQGFGVWALVVQAITMNLMLVVTLWALSGWRPLLTFSRSSVHKLFSFGGFHLAYGILEIAYARVYTVLIGKLYGTRELGYYANADLMRQIPGSFLSGVIARVAFPMLAANRADAATTLRGVQFATRGIIFINAPVMLTMAATADTLVRVLLGEKWLPAVSLVRILCVAGVLWPLQALHPYLLMAQNRARLMFNVEASKKAVGVVMFIVAASFGTAGIAWSMLVFSVFAFLTNAIIAGTLYGYSVGAQLRDVMPSTAVAVCVAGLLYFLSDSWQAPAALKLIGLFSIGAVSYLSLAWITNLVAMRDMVSLLRQLKPRITPSV